jgi:hypothetical protein
VATRRRSRARALGGTQVCVYDLDVCTSSFPGCRPEYLRNVCLHGSFGWCTVNAPGCLPKSMLYRCAFASLRQCILTRPAHCQSPMSHTCPWACLHRCTAYTPARRKLDAAEARDPSMRDDPHTATLAGAICMPPLWMQGDAAAPGCLSVEAESGRTVRSGGRQVDVPVLRGAVTPSRHMAFRSAMRAPRMMSGPRQSVKRKHSHEHKVNKHTHSQTPPSLFMTDRLQSVSVSPHTLRA